MLAQDVFKSPFVCHALGETDLRVTPLCLGSAALGYTSDQTDEGVPVERALETIRAFFLGPINFLDTFAATGQREVERRIGMILAEFGQVPAGFVLATRIACDPTSASPGGDQIRRRVEDSLSLLGLKQIPLVYLQGLGNLSFAASLQLQGPVDALLRCQAEGLIAHLGVAGLPLDILARFVETGLFDVVLPQEHYTLLNRGADQFLNLCVVRHVAVVNPSPFGCSMVGRHQVVKLDCGSGELSLDRQVREQRMAEACRRYDIPLAAAALQFSLRDLRIAATIVGGSKPAHLIEMVDLALQPVPDELWSTLDAIFRS